MRRRLRAFASVTKLLESGDGAICFRLSFSDGPAPRQAPCLDGLWSRERSGLVTKTHLLEMAQPY